MNERIRWSVAVLLGIAVAAVTYEFAGWRYAAVSTGLLWAFGVLLSTRAWDDLESRVETDVDWRAALWQGAPVAVLPFVVLPVTGTLDLSLGDETGVYLLVGGASFVAFFAGIGAAMAYLDRTERETVDPDATPS